MFFHGVLCHNVGYSLVRNRKDARTVLVVEEMQEILNKVMNQIEREACHILSKSALGVFNYDIEIGG